MATKNPRVNVTLDPDVYRVVRRISVRSGKSLSDVIRRLMSEAMELEEDAALAKIVGERRRKQAKPLSHSETWSRE